MSSKKLDRKRAKLEKKRRKLQKKLGRVEARLEKIGKASAPAAVRAGEAKTRRRHKPRKRATVIAATETQPTGGVLDSGDGF
jgi:hypothetical protein